MSDSSPVPKGGDPTLSGSTAAVVRASVQSGTIRADYFRAGRGMPTVLLSVATAGDPFFDGAFERLAEHGRVIAPDLPDPELAFPHWLGAVLDGLGVVRTALVADAGAAERAAQATAADADRFSALVVLGAAPPVEPGCPLLRLTEPPLAGTPAADALLAFLRQHGAG